MKMESKYFEEKGSINTDQTLKLAKDASIFFNIDTIVVASTKGESALKAVKVFDNTRYRLIIVKHHDGFRGEGNEFSEEIHNQIINHRPGTFFHVGTHALAGLERTFRIAEVTQTMLPIEIIAMTLRKCFGDGTKVSLEMALMVSDSGLIEDMSKDIICVAGTGNGLDTAWIVTPAYTNQLFNLKMKIPICKPKNF
jgi:hypothetical protein